MLSSVRFGRTFLVKEPVTMLHAFARVCILVLPFALGCAPEVNSAPPPRVPQGGGQSAQPPVVSQTFAGSWQTNWGLLDIVQHGSRVDGTYGGRFPGRLEGVVQGNRVELQWTGDNGETGRAYFILSPDGGAIAGRWGMVSDNASGGEWRGQRVR